MTLTKNSNYRLTKYNKNNGLKFFWSLADTGKISYNLFYSIFITLQKKIKNSLKHLFYQDFDFIYLFQRKKIILV